MLLFNQNDLTDDVEIGAILAAHYVMSRKIKAVVSKRKNT